MIESESDTNRRPMGSDYLAELIRNVTESTPQEQTIREQAPTTQTASVQTGDLLSSLLSNPALLSKLPSLLSAAGPVLELLSGASKQAPAEPQATLPTASVTEKTPAPKGREDRRTALLCAMKPYLSPERQNAIDYIVKLSKLGELLKTL